MFAAWTPFAYFSSKIINKNPSLEPKPSSLTSFSLDPNHFELKGSVWTEWLIGGLPLVCFDRTKTDLFIQLSPSGPIMLINILHWLLNGSCCFDYSWMFTLMLIRFFFTSQKFVYSVYGTSSVWCERLNLLRQDSANQRQTETQTHLKVQRSDWVPKQT